MSKLACPNVNSDNWKELVAHAGSREAYRAFLTLGEIPDVVTYKKLSEIKLKGWESIDFPESNYPQFSDQYAAMSAKKRELESQGAQVRFAGNILQYQLPQRELYFQQSNAVNALPRSVEVANTPKAQQEWTKLQKGNITVDQFLNNSQFPKEQKQLIKDIYDKGQPKTLGELISSLVANYSYTVEIETAKENIQNSKENHAQDIFEEGIIEPYTPEYYKEVERRNSLDTTRNTQHYSNLTVPGGTNGSYKELDVRTPQITPSIKSHAQFASTENSIGWYRVDDRETNIDKIYSELKKSGQLKIIC